jgi:hypothetical protein
MLGRIVVAALFLPKYFHGEMLTAYQLIDRRFGHTLHKVTAALFLLTRAAAEGVRVFAVSIVVAIAIGSGDILSIAIISALTLLYTFEGGMAAVIWTDVVQMAIYLAGTLVAIATLGHHVPGGWRTSTPSPPPPASSTCSTSPSTSPPPTPSGPESSAAPSSPWPRTAQTSSWSSACSPRATSRIPPRPPAPAASSSLSSSRFSC